MLIDQKKFHDWATRPGGPYPHHVAVREQFERFDSYWPDILDHCLDIFGPCGSHEVEEGFAGTLKVYQENRWCFTRLNWGNLYFENANDAALAKLSWG
jgi:hypothetical protein